MVDTSIVTIFLKKYFPELKGILCDEMLEPLINNYIQQSILGLFTSSLSEETSLFVWDFLFLEGNIILVKTFLALFGCLKKNFLQSKGDIEIVKNIIDKDTLKLEPSNDVLLHSFLIKKFEFNEEYLEQTRFKFTDIIAENLEEKNLENVQCKVKPNEEKINNQLNKNCCKRWPYCLYDGYFENVKTVIPYFIISHQEQMNLHSNYFFDEYTAVKERKSSFHEDAYNIMLERRQHYCTEVLEELKKERETTTTESSEVSNADLLKSSNMQMREMFTSIQNIPGYQKAANQIMKEFKPEPFRDINQSNNGNIKESNN